MPLLKLFAPPLDNCVVTVARLLGLLKVSVSKSSLQAKLAEHPDYPSLLSVSDVLSGFGVQNVAIRMNAEKMERLPVPFIAQLKGFNKGQYAFTVVKRITGKYVEFLSTEREEWIQLDKGEFIDSWTGIILLAEASSKSGEKDFLKNNKEEVHRSWRLGLMLLAIPLISFIAMASAFMHTGSLATFPSVYLLISLIGALTTLLLLQYELGEHNPVLQQICGMGKKTNCNAILDSKASKLAGVSWSMIGFCYFMGSVLAFLFNGLMHTSTWGCLVGSICWLFPIRCFPYSTNGVLPANGARYV